MASITPDSNANNHGQIFHMNPVTGWILALRTLKKRNKNRFPVSPFCLFQLINFPVIIIRSVRFPSVQPDARMNTPRSVLQRRQFLRSSSTLALGAAGTALATRKLFQTPSRASPARAPLAVRERPAIPPPEEAAEPAPPLLDRPLENEEGYTRFLLSLGLRHLSPQEIIDPHRGVIGNVENCLPSPHLWEKLIPTLRAADEIRERLGLPLCRITSGYRDPHYNAVIPGAVPGSYHTRNQALDLVYFCSSRKAFSMALQLRREGFFRGGIGLYPTFIHLDTRGHSATWQRV